MYSLEGFGEMISDHVRFSAYARALRATVRPGSVVLDIGTGTGVLALLACRYGAGRVYAVEPSPAIVVAREAALANGFKDRIVFLQCSSREVRLERKADVVVSDLHGVLPPFGTALRDIADARDRLLAPGGCMVPRADTLWAAVAAAPALWRQHGGPWHTRPEGLDLSSAAPRVTNTWCRARLSARHLVAKPQRWAQIDYRTLTSGRAEGRPRWTFHRSAVAHGLLVWFDTNLAPGVAFSNSPGQQRTIYGQAFFPWPQPVRLGKGDRLAVHLRADLAGSDYVWSWDTSVKRAASSREEGLAMQQSTFRAALLSPETLTRRASSHRVILGEAGQAVRMALDLMDGVRTLGEVASDVQELFPARFGSPAEALAFVSDLSTRYGQ